MNWIFKPNINGIDIVIIIVMSEFGFDLLGYWGLLVMFSLFVLSSKIEEKIWKVSLL